MITNGYANAYYEANAGLIWLFTWDDEGNRITLKHRFRPYVYFEDDSSTSNDNKTIFGTRTRKKEWPNSYERKRELINIGVNRVFQNLQPVQQYLVDQFSGLNETKEFSRFDLKVQYLDIEVLSKNEFPEPDEAKYPINLITVYDTDSKKMVTFGEREIKRKINTDYRYYSNEVDLLKAYINFVADDYPHVMSGWNSSGFDMPYIINRIKNVLGDDWLNKLSPVRKVRDAVEYDEKGNSKDIKVIEGLHSIDSLDIYKKFCPDKRESYRLDFVGEIEIGRNKLDYGNQSFWDLANSDWDTFVEYNVIDVEILRDVMIKTRYMDLTRMVSTIGLTTLNNGLSSLNFITGALAVFAKKKNLVIPTFMEKPESMSFEGGYVAEPVRGIKEKILSFDANSLYPNTMITLNTSPETKIGKIIAYENGIRTVRHVNGEFYNLNEEKFKQFMERSGAALSKSNVLFSQKKRGIMPDMVEYYYKQRVSVKGKMKALEKKIEKYEAEGKDTEELENELVRLDTLQWSIKIIINSVYGAAGNRFFCFADLDIAESITATGREMIKQSAIIVNNYINKTYGLNPKTNNIQYNDTDSTYLTMKNIYDKVGTEPFVVDNKITNYWVKVSDEIGNALNSEISQWAKDELGSNDPRFEFKREAICPETLFLAKKKYVLHILLKEDKHKESWKFVGLEVKQSSMPKKIRIELEQIIKHMVSSKDFATTNDKVRAAYESYANMSLFEVSNISTANNLPKWEKLANGLRFGKGTPAHVKAAMAYNYLLDNKKIAGKYEKINSSEKVRYFPVQQPNQFGIKTIGYKYKWPVEFDDELHIDLDAIKIKQIYKCISRCYEANGWHLFLPDRELALDLYSLMVIHDGISRDSEISQMLDEEDNEELYLEEQDYVEKYISE